VSLTVAAAITGDMSEFMSQRLVWLELILTSIDVQVWFSSEK